MNKQAIIDLLLKNIELMDLKPEQVVLGFGGALVLMGLRGETDDIDLDVPLASWCKFCALGGEIRKTMFGACFNFSENISLKAMSNRKPAIQVIDGIQCYAPTYLLWCYERMSRNIDRPVEKRRNDRKAVIALVRYLKGHKE